MDEKMRIEGNGEVRSQPWPRQFDNDPSKWFELIYKIPKREWVGLTDEEIFDVYKQVDSMQYLTFGKAIEAKLKEKNT
jgi:hypothetical protein